MRLEYRTVELLENNGTEKIYKLKCSLEESFKYKPYIIEQEPLVRYGKSKLNSFNEWSYSCYTENIGTGMIFNSGTPKEKVSWDEHLTFIIPDYWKQKGLKEGFYEAGEYEKACDSLKCYVRRLGDNSLDYCLQYMGGGGDEEYTYLKTLCDIEDALVWADEMAIRETDDIRRMMTSILPLGIRTYITVKVPFEIK